jgi:cytochrome c-type biogenesis protein CcmE
MDRRRLKFVLLVGGVVAAMGFLLAVGLQREGGLAYFVTVSEFKNAPTQKGVRVNGKVADGSIERLPSGQDVTFVMTDGQTSLPVAYHGIIPDTFVEGADVVVEGSLDQQSGTFHANNLLAKCPSKYEAAAEKGEKAPHEDAPLPRGPNEG